MPKNAQTTAQVALISYASKVMLKILQPRLQQYANRELPDLQVGFKKGRGNRDQIPTSTGSFLRAPWTAIRSNQSILKEISPEYSLEGLMLKLKLQFFDHLM